MSCEAVLSIRLRSTIEQLTASGFISAVEVLGLVGRLAGADVGWAGGVLGGGELHAAVGEEL